MFVGAGKAFATCRTVREAFKDTGGGRKKGKRLLRDPSPFNFQVGQEVKYGECGMHACTVLPTPPTPIYFQCKTKTSSTNLGAGGIDNLC